MIKDVFITCALTVCILTSASAECVQSQFRRIAHTGFSAGSMKVSEPCKNFTGSVVVFVTYFGLSGMDFYSGPEYGEMENSQRDELFKREGIFAYRRLTQELVKQGFTVVQYDPLAAGCYAEVGSPTNPFCVKTAETNRARLSDFYERLQIVLAETFEIIRPESYRSLILVSHSGASVVASDFLREAGGNFRGMDVGFVGLSPAIGSGLEAVRFQKVDYWVRQFERCANSRFEGCALRVLSDNNFQAHVQRSDRDRIAEKVREQGARSVKGIRELLEKAHSRTVDWLIASTREPSSKASASVAGGLIQPNADLVRELLLGNEDRGANLPMASACRLIYGELDTALSPEQERDAWVRMGGRAEDVLVLPARGHWLGDDPLTGPPSEMGIAAVLKAVADVSQRISRSTGGAQATASSCLVQPGDLPPNKLQ